jgi:hypothetical protein
LFTRTSFLESAASRAIARQKKSRDPPRYYLKRIGRIDRLRTNQVPCRIRCGCERNSVPLRSSGFLCPSLLELLQSLQTRPDGQMLLRIRSLAIEPIFALSDQVACFLLRFHAGGSLLSCADVKSEARDPHLHGEPLKNSVTANTHHGPLSQTSFSQWVSRPLGRSSYGLGVLFATSPGTATGCSWRPRPLGLRRLYGRSSVSPLGANIQHLNSTAQAAIVSINVVVGRLY